MDRKKEFNKFDYIFDGCSIVGLGDMPTLYMLFTKSDGSDKYLESIIYYN